MYLAENVTEWSSDQPTISSARLHITLVLLMSMTDSSTILGRKVFNKSWATFIYRTLNEATSPHEAKLLPPWDPEGERPSQTLTHQCTNEVSGEGLLMPTSPPEAPRWHTACIPMNGEPTSLDGLKLAGQWAFSYDWRGCTWARSLEMNCSREAMLPTSCCHIFTRGDRKRKNWQNLTIWKFVRKTLSRIVSITCDTELHNLQVPTVLEKLLLMLQEERDWLYNHQPIVQTAQELNPLPRPEQTLWLRPEVLS